MCKTYVTGALSHQDNSIHNLLLRLTPCDPRAGRRDRGVEIFPPPAAAASSHGQVFVNSWYEDDGISVRPRIARSTVRYRATRERVVVGFARDDEDASGFVPAWRDLDIILHCGDERCVVAEDGRSTVVFKGKDSRGRVVYTFKN